MTLRLPAPVLLALIGAVIVLLLGLGVWQLQRNDWKQGLVAERNARTDDAALSIEDARALDLDQLDYRRLGDAAAWDTDRSFVLANRARFDTKGEELVVPLLIAPPSSSIAAGTRTANVPPPKPRSPRGRPSSTA